MIAFEDTNFDRFTQKFFQHYEILFCCIKVTKNIELSKFTKKKKQADPQTLSCMRESTPHIIAYVKRPDFQNLPHKSTFLNLPLKMVA